MTDASTRAEQAKLAEKELLDVIGGLRQEGHDVCEAWAEQLETVLKRVRRIGGLND